MAKCLLQRPLRVGLVILLAVTSVVVSNAPGTTWAQHAPTPKLPNAELGSITASVDGAIWFADTAHNAIWRMTLRGQFAGHVTLPSPPRGIATIVADADGGVWFAESTAKRLGLLTRSGRLREFALTGNPFDLALGPRHSVWFTKTFTNGNQAIARMTLDGRVTDFHLPGGDHQGIPLTLTIGPDRNVWFGEIGTRIGTITAKGDIREFTVNSLRRDIFQGITAAPDGNLWFTSLCRNMIGRMTVRGHVTTFPCQDSRVTRAIVVLCFS
jgi:virginiamycin B lyase